MLLETSFTFDILKYAQDITEIMDTGNVTEKIIDINTC